MSIEGGVAERSAQSAGWLFGRQVFTNSLRFITLAVLAHRLTPAEFGVVTLATILILFITLVNEAGVHTYAIYVRGDGWERKVQGAFWLNEAITLAQLALCLAVIPIVDRAFSATDELVPVMLALMAMFFVQQLAVVPEALLQRELRHPLLARRDVVVDIGIAVVSVALAFGGAGVWSLVIPLVVFAPVRTFVTILLARWRPHLPFEVRLWPEIVGYTSHLIGTNALSLVSNDGDTLLVGRVLGSGSVGFYNLAWALSNIVGRTVTNVVNSVAFPALAKLRDDEVRLRTGYLRMVAFLGTVCFPLLVGMAAVAPELVLTFYGPQWEPVVDLLRILIIFTLFRSVTSPAATVFNVTGRPDIGLKFQLGFTPIYVVAIVVGANWGLAGIATGVVVTRVAGALIVTQLAGHQIRLGILRMARALLPAAALAGSMGVGVWTLMGVLTRAEVGPVARLVTGILLGGVAYVAGLAVFKPPGSEDLLGYTRSMTPKMWSRLRRGRPSPDAYEPD